MLTTDHAHIQNPCGILTMYQKIYTRVWDLVVSTLPMPSGELRTILKVHTSSMGVSHPASILADSSSRAQVASRMQAQQEALIS